MTLVFFQQEADHLVTVLLTHLRQQQKAVVDGFLVQAETARDEPDVVRQVVHRLVVRTVRREDDVDVRRPELRQPIQPGRIGRRQEVVETVEDENQLPISRCMLGNVVHGRREIVEQRSEFRQIRWCRQMIGLDR